MIPAHLLPSICNVLTRSQTFSSDSGEASDTWNVTATGIRCRLDVNTDNRYVAQTSEYTKATHRLFISPGTGVVLDPKTNQVQVDGINYRIIGVDKMYGAPNSIHHYEILLMRIF